MDKLFAEFMWIIVAYIIGSIPFGLLIARKVKGIDLRNVGSGNIGATNVARTVGTRYGALTFLLDLLKGLVPVVVAGFMSESTFFISMVGLSAFLGHLYPLFLNFKGGKGVATTMGVYFAISPTLTVLALIPSLFFIWLSGYVSLGSLIFALLVPVLFLLSFKLWFFLLGFLIFCFIYVRHKQNIVRLAKGIENPWKNKKLAGNEANS